MLWAQIFPQKYRSDFARNYYYVSKWLSNNSCLNESFFRIVLIAFCPLCELTCMNRTDVQKKKGFIYMQVLKSA